MAIRNYSNLIFDLGEVLLDLDFNASVIAFLSLGWSDYGSAFNADSVSSLFQQLEMGLISENIFFDTIRSTIGNSNISNENIELAWNAMLGNFYTNRIALLHKLKSEYQLYLLSNTNSIHARYFESIYLNQFGGDELKNLFHRVYYSHEMNLRKPNAEIYLKLVENEKIKLSETIFFDDNQANIESARKIGLHSFRIPRKSTITIIDSLSAFDSAMKLS